MVPTSDWCHWTRKNLFNTWRVFCLLELFVWLTLWTLRPTLTQVCCYVYLNPIKLPACAEDITCLFTHVFPSAVFDGFCKSFTSTSEALWCGDEVPAPHLAAIFKWNSSALTFLRVLFIIRLHLLWLYSPPLKRCVFLGSYHKSYSTSYQFYLEKHLVVSREEFRMELRTEPYMQGYRRVCLRWRMWSNMGLLDVLEVCFIYLKNGAVVFFFGPKY